MSYRPSKPITLVALLGAVAILVVLAMRWRNNSEPIQRAAQGPPQDCTTDACRIMTKTVSTEDCHADPATPPGFKVYYENDDPGGRTVNIQVTQYGTSPGFPDTSRTWPETLSPGPAGKWNAGCTEYFSPTPLPEHVVKYQYS